MDACHAELLRRRAPFSSSWTTRTRSRTRAFLPRLRARNHHRSRRQNARQAEGLALHTRIFIGLAVGVAAGVLANITLGGDDPRVVWVVSNITEPIGTLFLRLLLMIVVPLVFSSLVVGVAGIGDVRKLGRVGLKSFAYCLVISAISVVIGTTVANTIRPGERVDPDDPRRARSPLRLRRRQTRRRRHQETRHARLRPDAGRQDPRPVESRRLHRRHPGRRRTPDRHARHAASHALRRPARHRRHARQAGSRRAVPPRTCKDSSRSPARSSILS